MFDVIRGLKLEPFMQFKAMELKRHLLVPVLLLLPAAAGPVWAQAANSPIVFQSPAAITCALVDAPQLGETASGGGGGTERGQWLRVEWHYTIAPKTPVPFVDAIEFRVWVEGRDLYATEATTADGIPVALTGAVTYINLPEMRDGYGAIYVHPSTLARYGSKDASDFTEKFNVHVEAYVGGVKMDFFDKNKPQDPNWYQTLKAVPNLLIRQDQCPFIIDDSARYPQLKPLPAAQ
jgi:hypothetical protein